MTKSALIGYTGFVGGNIAAKHSFDANYNTKNINDIDGGEFDLVVSAATRAEMWRINQDPDTDWAEITQLMDHLKTIKAKQFVLISTIAVFRDSVNKTEDSPINLDGVPPYGVHRYKLEQFVREQFANVLVVRLPGLFGHGLKKNIIYDLIHNNNVERIHRAASVQYYNLAHLWENIQTALQHDISLLHAAVPPLRTDEITRECFDMQFTNEPAGVTPVQFDFKTKHAQAFGGQNGYLYSKEQVLSELKTFVQAEQAKL